MSDVPHDLTLEEYFAGQCVTGFLAAQWCPPSQKLVSRHSIALGRRMAVAARRRRARYARLGDGGFRKLPPTPLPPAPAGMLRVHMLKTRRVSANDVKLTLRANTDYNVPEAVALELIALEVAVRQDDKDGGAR